MSISQLYFNLGIQHILDLVAFDHMLFLWVLSAPYAFRNFKKIFGLATLFTVGHTLTLFLSTFDKINFSMVWIEFLIPCTILITALGNLLASNKTRMTSVLPFFASLFFGLIHGMGFSNYLKSLLSAESNIVKPLLFFNLGIELAQLFVIAGLLLLNYFICKSKLQRQVKWNFIFSSVAAVIAIILIIQRFPV